VICFSSALVRRAVFERVGYFDEALPLAIDYDLWLRVALHFRFDYVDEALVKYRTGHSSLSRRTGERLAIVRQIMERFLAARGGREAPAPSVVRRARAETYYHTALERRRTSRLAALPWYVRCLFQAPGFGLAWQGLASLALPEAVRRWCRRLVG